MWNILYDRKHKQKHEHKHEQKHKHKHKHKNKIDEESDVESSNAELKTLEKEFYGLIPHHAYKPLVLLSRVATKLDLCQMIRDVVYINEETGWQKRPTQIAKYRALRCYIQHLPSNHPEYEKIRRLVLSTMPGGMKLNTLRIFAVSRPPEEEGYCHDIGNDTLLFHATKPNNVLGILSRGLLMPKVVVEMFNGQRRDEGLLGPGLYFGDRISTCIQYTKNGFFSKTRMILVLKVALGATEDYYEFNTKLQQAPDGFNSTHGVRASDGRPSEFTEDEFVVYSTKQQCIRYLVEFSFDGDDDLVDGYDYDEDDVKDDEMEEEKETLDKIDLADVQCCQDPVSRTATGLVVDNSREGVLLEQVHVRGHITDLAAKITVLQVYQNTVGGTDVPEARYVFPLDEKAAVCGFEAFINDRHVVGTVKTKEKAKEEYQEAVREGHGAYLMQEEASNVFSVSIGNLPPYAKVVIKITYVTELVEEDGGKMAFYLLGSVAPWLQEEIRGTKLTEEAQALVGVPSNETDRKESLQLTVEMPSDISTVQSPTHAIKLKREKMKATVTLGDGVGLGDGFQLLIGILNANKPRIWTEFDPSNNSYASMAVFYPTIQSDSIPDPEVVLLMDCSTSMKGEPKQDAKKICKMLLQSLPKKSRFNVITFGTDFIELFPTVEPTGQQQLHQAFEFIESAKSIGGSSEGWRPLRSLSLLPMMKSVRNVLLVSDGHLTNEKLILEIASNYKNVNRIFTCGVGSAGNRHILRALADVSGGAFESFNPKAKSKWEGKISAQIDRCRQPSVSCVNAKWRTEENADGSMKLKDLIQVPAQTSSVFTGSKVLLYSLGPKVQEVQLNVEIAGKSVEESLKSPIEFEGSSLTLHRLAGRALVRDYEFGSFHQDHALHETRMYDLTKYLTDLSIRLSIITPLTSFIAIEKRDRKTKIKTASPDVDKLLSMITRDDLESLHWTEVILEQEGPAESIVTKILRQAKIAQSNFSYASAEKYYNSALNMAKENMTSMQGLFKTCCLELSKFTMRVKGDAEKALQWIQPVVTHVTEQVEEEGEDQALDTTAREYSQLLQNKVRQGPAEKDVISRATGYVQRGPTAVRPISLAKKEIRKAVKYQSRRTFPFSSFLKPKKKEKKKMEPISFAMHSAAPAERRQFRGGVVSMSSKPKEERALDQRETELVDDDNRATTLDQATLDELRRQATRLEEQLKKEDSLLASVKVFKKKKSLGRSSLFGWGKGKSKREKTVVKSKGATISIGSGEKKYEEREEAARYLPSARLMKFAESDKKVCDSTAESRRPSPPAMDADEDRSLEASKDSLHEKEGEDETTYALSAEYSPPSSPALARARPIEVLSQGSPETSDDEFQQMYSLLSASTKSRSLSSTPSPPEVYLKYGPARPESPPSPPLVLGAEAPLPSPSGPPQPPPVPPTSGSVLTRKMLGVTRRMLGVSPPPPLPSRSMPLFSSASSSGCRPTNAGSVTSPAPPLPPPSAGLPTSRRMPVVPPPPPPPLPPRSMPSSLLHSPLDAAPPMPGVSPPPPPTPPPPAGLPTSRRMPVVPHPPTAPRFQPRSKSSSRFDSTDLKSKDKSVADQDMMFDLTLLSTITPIMDGDDDDEDDIIWEDGELMEPKKTCKSPIIFKESKRTVSDFNHVMSLQNKDGMWSWEAHGHLIDDLFVIDFQDIYAFCCQLPILPYVRQNLRSILLTLLLLIYLEDVLPEVLPNLEDTSPSNQDANGKFVNYTECTERAEEWLKRRETDQLLSLKTLLYNNLG
ncbi:LOW QUALITY PROTEIN: protein mono-ADP-ribosyltransferase PARP4-like [Lytechinus variegatus]|uniref:LOW QUALITY PROTEIN: protein mono-ADP-ribosyltransferase PARP4-like n=1 Tax=Lytechinus variegatus TaxID=7654 RepID=UPI001BB23ADA|nr:LOW QUALITY PROTEIN: protein mono-ADP-ribosyltransferase PARP4-like [Lytechinus variegatus]